MLRKVLANSGGGIRGILQCELLSFIEQSMGRPAAETFDLIAGTSTGGICALALALPGPDGRPRYSAADVSELYKRNGNRIFDRGLFDGLGGLTDERYPSEGIESVLKEYFGDIVMGNLLTHVMVCTYAPESWRILILKSWKLEHGPVKCRDAARATSAAPTYFEPARIRINMMLQPLIDGGLNLNNPAMSAYAEARLLWPDDEILVVSVGTGRAAQELRYEDFKDWGVLWLPVVLKISMCGQEAHEQLRKLQGAGDVTYFHFDTVLDRASDDMDDASPENIGNLQRDAARMIYENLASIENLCAILT